MATRNLTVTANLGPAEDALPADPPFVEPVGFKSVLTRVSSGGKAESPALTEAFWTFGSLNVGEEYMLDLSVVDGQGRAIQSWPRITFTVPAVPVEPAPAVRYTPIIGVQFAWD